MGRRGDKRDASFMRDIAMLSTRSDSQRSALPARRAQPQRRRARTGTAEPARRVGEEP